MCDNDIRCLKMNDIYLERVMELKYLGIYLDENLSWSSHVNSIGTKISKSIGIIRRLNRVLPEKILKTLYYALIHPHINYCMLLWGYNSEKIKRLQKQAVRAVTQSHFRAHSSNIFFKLNILKVEDLF